MLKKILTTISVLLLSACNSMLFQPVETISQITPNQGYRAKNIIEKHQDGNLIILMLSGGGSRAATLGYGVLEQFKQAKIGTNPLKESLLDNIEPESPLKQEVLNINTSFYLPNKDINKLKQAAQILLQNSKEYQGVLEALR